MRIRLGTRRSALAMTQSRWVAVRLVALGHEVELVEVTTFGDTSSAPLASIGGTGVFASALRQALLEGAVDIAVHSLKDLPVLPEPDLVVAAIPAREDPRDALVARDGLTLGELPPGSVVGTGAPRRAAQLAALGLRLVTTPIRGNVDTRISLVRDGSCDAVVLARAGLARLGRLEEVTEVLHPTQVLGAAGQGALAVECRADDPATVAALAALDDADTRACVTAERSLLAALEAGCTAPIGALAEISEGAPGEPAELSLRAFVGTEDGSLQLRRSLVGTAQEPERLGQDLATLLLRDGAGRVTGPGLPAGPGATAPGPSPDEPPPEPRGAGGASALPAAADPRIASRPHHTVSERAQ